MKREAILCPDVPSPIMGSHAVKAGDFVFLGGQIASDYHNGLAAEVRTPPAAANAIVAAKVQSDYVLGTTQKILGAAGSSLANGVMIDQFVTHPAAASAYLETRARHVDPSIRPASTHIQLREFLVPKASVALRLIAVADRGSAQKEMVYVEDIPKSPGGPFKGGAQGVKAGGLVFLTGQVASDFQSSVAPEARVNPAFWYGSPIKLQTDYVLKRLQKVLESAGSSLQDVVKADVYLTNMRDVYEMDEVWRQFFPEHPPARAIIPATRLAPLDCIVEINMIALERRAGIERAQVLAGDVPPPALHQPHAVRAGRFVFLSGLYATDTWDAPSADAALHPEMPYFGSFGRRQTESILRRAAAICRAAGAQLEDILWMQAYYTDLREFQASLDAWQQAFSEAPPAAFAAGVEAPHAVPGCSIAMDAVALTAG